MFPFVPEQDFKKLLKLNTLGEFLYSGTAVGENGHLFGGYTLAFALEAASATVDPTMWPQSIHANFIDAGKSGHELRMHVEVLRDTRAFAMRQVTVKMGDLNPLLMQASFHAGEDGPDLAPEVAFDYPDPETLVTDDLSTVHESNRCSTYKWPKSSRPRSSSSTSAPVLGAAICEDSG